MQVTMKPALLALLLMLLPGCVVQVYGVARATAAQSLACPEGALVQLSTRSRSSGYHYRFGGCGREVTVDCVELLSSSRIMCR